MGREEHMSAGTARYFEPHDPRPCAGLARVDLDPAHHVAQMLSPTGWVTVLCMFRVALFYGEAWDWDEITPEAAAERARHITGDVAALAD
jgi:hypothetical protein